MSIFWIVITIFAIVFAIISLMGYLHPYLHRSGTRKARAEGKVRA